MKAEGERPDESEYLPKQSLIATGTKAAPDERRPVYSLSIHHRLINNVVALTNENSDARTVIMLLSCARPRS